MSKLPSGKYQLKSLYEEIDLFDRKLAHLLRYEEFASDTARRTAAKSLATKREQLVRAAQQMKDEGVESNESDLPRSFRVKPVIAGAVLTESAILEPETGLLAQSVTPHPSPYAGTSMDPQKSLQEYKRRRKKA